MQGVGPAMGGVRLSDRPILGPDAGPAPVATGAKAEAPGMLDRVKQLVGLGPASTTSAVCSLLLRLAASNQCVVLNIFFDINIRQISQCYIYSRRDEVIKMSYLCSILKIGGVSVYERYSKLSLVDFCSKLSWFSDVTNQQSQDSRCCLQDLYEGAQSPSSPITASQGINAGIMGSSGRTDSYAIDDVDDDAFEDALEDPISDSFTSPVGTGVDAGQPYVSQPGPPVVDTRSDPDETFGPLKNRDQSAQPAGSSYEPSRGFGDDDEDEGTPGKKGLRAKVKGKIGFKKEHHQEKKKNKADQELQHKMHEKEIPKAQAVTVGDFCASDQLLPSWTCCLGTLLMTC